MKRTTADQARRDTDLSNESIGLLEAVDASIAAATRSGKRRIEFVVQDTSVFGETQWQMIIDDIAERGFKTQGRAMEKNSTAILDVSW